MHLKEAVTAANRLRQRVELELAAGTICRTPLTVSIGGAEFNGSDTIEAVLHRADVTLYEAKRQGRNRVSI